MRIGAIVSMTGFALVLGVALTPAKAASPAKAAVVVHAAAASEFSAQSRRRRPLRLRVYGRGYGYLPPTARRDCHAWYEQERRPSGAVIVPRMSCRWVNG